MLFLSNVWLIWFFNTYSMIILAVPTVIGFILQIIAVLHPGIPTDNLIDVVKHYWSGSTTKI